MAPSPVYHAVPAKQVEAEVVIAPLQTAVRSSVGDSQRDGRITVIEQHGRMKWQRETRYGLRN